MKTLIKKKKEKEEKFTLNVRIAPNLPSLESAYASLEREHKIAKRVIFINGNKVEL